MSRRYRPAGRRSCPSPASRAADPGLRPEPRAVDTGWGRSFAAVERFDLLPADRRQVFRIRGSAQPRLELRQPLLHARGPGIAIERREALAQLARVLLLHLGQRDLTPQFALFALYRLELRRDVHELARVRRQGPVSYTHLTLPTSDLV